MPTNNPNERPAENPVQKRQYMDLYLGSSEVSGHIDAVHAAPINSQENLQYLLGLVHTGQFQGKDQLFNPNSDTIYLNKKMRRVLNVQNANTLKLSDNKVLKIKNARNKIGGGYHACVVSPNNLEDLKNYFQKMPHDRWDEATGEIAEKVASKGANAIVFRVSRDIADGNRLPDNKDTLNPAVQKGAVEEFRDSQDLILQHVGNNAVEENGNINVQNPYLQIALHGKKDVADLEDQQDADIILGTRNSETCTYAVQGWFFDRLKEKMQGIKINDRPVNIKINCGRLDGDPSKMEGRGRYGDLYNTIQVEVCKHLRKNHQDELAEILYAMLREFTDKFTEIGQRREDIKETLTSTKTVQVSYQYKHLGQRSLLTMARKFAAESLGLTEGDMVRIKNGEKELILAVHFEDKFEENYGESNIVLMDGVFRNVLGVNVNSMVSLVFEKI